MVDVGQMGDAALFVLVLLMFIGASPGSWGGIKRINLAILLSLGYNRFTGRTEAVIFRRTVTGYNRELDF